MDTKSELSNDVNSEMGNNSELDMDLMEYENDTDTDYEMEFTATEIETENESESDRNSENGIDSETDSESENDIDSEIELELDPENYELENDVESAIQQELSTEFGESQYSQSLNLAIRKWAITHNIAHDAISDLLKILISKGHISLPRDSRTLLETPKTVKVTPTASGMMWFRSLKKKLSDIVKNRNCPNTLKLELHIDGTPIYNSTKIEFWPIQVGINGVKVKDFFVGLYIGVSKPSSPNFIKPIIDELLELIENGITENVNGSVRSFVIELYKILMDAPARAFMKCIIGHSGYFSCERCTEEGIYLLKSGDKPVKKNSKKKTKQPNNNGHVCLIGTDAPLRTDASFRAKENEEHHHCVSPLEVLPINMIRTIPLDYLHLILLGVQKKLILHWLSGTANFKTKLSSWDVTQISNKLVKSGLTKPFEINKPCRPLTVLSFWKAKEFRTFLLKTGPVVLKGHLSDEAYNHFLALHCAVTICSSKSLLPYLKVAKDLFYQFTVKFGEIYGYENYTYNVHSLIHVTDDVEHFGVIDEYSTFKGESNLGALKRLLRGGFKPLQQVVKRIMEFEFMEFFEPEKDSKQGLNKGILRLSDIRLDTSDRNRWILTKDRTIFKINGFSDHLNIIQLHGAILDKRNQRNVYETPIESSKLCIYKSKLDEKEEITINVDDIYCKLYRIEVSGMESAFFPLFHFTQ